MTEPTPGVPSPLASALSGRYALAAGGRTAGQEAIGREPERFIVVVNWFEELKEEMGDGGRP